MAKARKRSGKRARAGGDGTLTLEIPRLYRAARFAPGSWDPNTCEATIVWSAGARALQFDWDRGLFEEELEMTDAACRLERMNTQGPVLDSHQTWGLANHLGVALRSWLEGGEGHSIVRLAKIPSTKDLRDKLDQGIPPGISCGYNVYQYRDVTTADDRRMVLRAVDWEPFEYSLLCVPADYKAGFRSDGTLHRCTFQLKESTMDDDEELTPEQRERARCLAIREAARRAAIADTQIDAWIRDGATIEEVNAAIVEGLGRTRAGAGSRRTAAAGGRTRRAAGAGTAVADPEDEDPPADDEPEPAPRRRSDDARTERARCLEIVRLGQAHASLGQAFIDEHLDAGTSLDRFRELVIDRLAERDSNGTGRTRQASTAATTNPGSAGSPGGARAAVGEEDAAKRLRAIGVAIQHRAMAPDRIDEHGRPVYVDLAATEGAREFRHMTLLDICREVLTLRGVSWRGLNKLEIAQRALHTTGDFSTILSNVGNKGLQMAYQTTPATWLQLATRTNATDFKPMTRAQLGDAAQLREVPESGRFDHGSVGEGGETYRIKTAGRILALSRQAVVNDDLSAFERLPRSMGNAAREYESDKVWDLITSNVVMETDGEALFSAAHSNLATGVISVASLGAARALLRKQKGIPNDEGYAHRINVRPRYLWVPTALEAAAEQHIANDIVPNAVGSVNPFKGKLEPIVEPRLDDKSALEWYLSGAPQQVEMIEYAYLDGAEGPVLEQQMGFEVDGIQFKVRLDFGAQVNDHRGMVRSSGAA